MSLMGGIAALVSCFVLAPAAPQGAAAQAGQWGSLLEWGIQGKHMVLLPTGDVLVWSTGEKARVWDPETGAFTLTPATFGDLHCAGHVTLPDGRVIVLGGTNGDTHIGTTVTAIFDHSLNRWTQGRPMNFARWYASVTALPDGRVLVTSGDDGTGQRVMRPEVYDPVTDTWTVLTSAVRDQSLYPLMYVLPDGRVYESGPKTSTAFLNTSGRGSWTSGPPNLYSTSGYSESSVMYSPGKILRAGGDDPAIDRSSVIDMTAASPQWRDTDTLNFARRRMNLVLLADGKCLAVGGTRESDSEAQAVLDCEIWDPATGLWTAVAAMSEARMYHSTAILLPDGRVVTAGGEAAGRERAQIYSPPYLFQGARPVITAAPANLAYGSTFEVESPSASSIASVALLRPSAATHAWDQNQRYVPLSFGLSAGRLSVAAPQAAGMAPPGFYMLVIKDAAGVPSVGRFLRVGTSQDLTPGAIHGTVTDASTLAPIAGATVATSEATTTTAGNGSYDLDPLSSGEHVVTFSAAGYATVTRSVDVPGGGTATLDVSLAQPGRVVGSVTDASTGQPLAGALILHPGGTTTTDASGQYAVEGVPAGSQALTASSTGYTSLQKTASVPANGTATLDFALAPSATYIAGGVLDIDTSQPIVGASVSYSAGATTTDSLGRYRFDGVAPGTHRLTASASGYVSQASDVIVSEGAGSFHDFGLIAGIPRIKNITFEGGSLTDLSTGADAKAGLVLLETLRPLAGRFSARVRVGNAYVDESFAATDELFLVMTLSVTARPAADPRVIRIMNNGTTLGNVQLRSTGRLRLRNGSSTIGAETSPLVLGTTYRLGLHQRRGTGGNGVLEAFLSVGNAPFGAPFAAITNGTWTSPANRLQVGATSSDTANLYFDDVLIDSVSMPSGGGPPPPTAAFDATPTSGVAPLAVSFTDTSSGTPTSWSWNFGDGSISTVRNPTHSYAAGTFAVSLKVSGPGGSNTLTKPSLIVVTGSSGGNPFALGNPAPGTAGVPNTLVVTGATPNALLSLVTGQLLGSSLVQRPNCGAGIPIGIGAPFSVLGSVRANASGTATFVISPGVGTAGKTFHFQAIEAATCKASNLASDVL